MSILLEHRLNLFLLQKTQWMLTKTIRVSNYDFNFQQFFDCQHPYQLPSSVEAVARIGAIDNYAEFYETLHNEGIKLVHTPQEHLKCSELPHWYPLLTDLTPKSMWFSELPTLEQIMDVFDFPFFMKGSRQTSKHKRSLSIIDSEATFNEAIRHYAKDPILHWQDIVCREYIPLKPIQGGDPDKIPASYEFRTFWWHGEFVGAGQYWFQADTCQWTPSEKEAALTIAREAAKRIAVTFLVVDIALCTDGKWIVIECNDGQESGYAGLAPLQLWKNILALQ